MHPPRSTIGSLLFIVAAFSIGLAALKEKDLEGIGLSMLMIIGLLGAAFGACFDAGPADGVALAWSVRNPIDRRSSSGAYTGFLFHCNSRPEMRRPRTRRRTDRNSRERSSSGMLGGRFVLGC